MKTLTDQQRLKRYKYHVVYCGAPYGWDENGEEEFGHIISSFNSLESIDRFMKSHQNDARLYGRNSYLYDSDSKRKISNELNDKVAKY